MFKYLILFPIPDPFYGQLCMLMDRVAHFTGLPQPYVSLAPHLTFHRPITGIDEQTLRNLTASATLQIRQTRITLSGLHPFGKHYIVLPVHATRAVAALWVGIGGLLARLPEYEHGPYDDDNTLHVTIAAKTTPVFDRSWSEVRKIPVEPMDIPLKAISLCQKPTEGGKWREIGTFPIPA